MVVDGLTRRDARAAAALHKRAFDRFFLASLGESFLREFYTSFISDPDAVTTTFRGPGGELQGIVIGALNPQAFFRRLLRRRWLHLAIASARSSITHPSRVFRLIRGLAYRGQVPVRATGALLSSICVAPEIQHTGLGRMLIEAWWREARERGARSAYLTTDADGNERTNRFYIKAGWSLIGTYSTGEGRRMNCYVIDVLSNLEDGQRKCWP